MPRKTLFAPRFVKNRHPQAQFDWEAEECPGTLLQLPVGLDDDDCEVQTIELCPRASNTPEKPASVHHRTTAADRVRADAMYVLAHSCDDRLERIRWLTLAAERGHVQAMHDLGLASAALHERRRWLLEAARHGWAEALAELGDVECS